MPPADNTTQLRETTEWWRCFFELSEDAVVICNGNAEIVKVNTRAIDLLALHGQILNRLSLSTILTPSLFHRVQAFLQFPGERQLTFSGISLMAHGHLRLIADLHIGQLSPGFFLLNIKDAGLRWRIESHAKRLATATDATSDVFFFTDSEFKLGYVNASFQTVTGYNIEEVLGHTADFLRAPSQAGLIKEYLASVLKGKSWSGELINIRRDGSEYPVESTISPIFDKGGSLLGYVACERDVSAKKKLQEELMLERNFSNSILDSIDSAIYAIDTQFKLVQTNDGWKRLPSPHGFISITHFPATNSNFFDYVDEGKRDELKAFFHLAMASRKAHVLSSSSHNGHWVVKISPWLHDADVRGIIYTVSDESKLHELQKQLYQAQKMETVGTLAAGVAHDFNNLLQVIRGNVELALTDEKNPADTRWSLQQINEVTERAAEITHQMLSFSRDTDENIVVFDFNNVITEVASLLRHSMPSNIELIIQRAPGNLNVQMDSTRANQLVLNLCVNARDAMPSGGKLTVVTTLEHLSEDQALRQQRVAGSLYVQCQVIDTGVGIPPEILPRIFDPFFTTKENGKGTGLGLSIAHDAITRAGGFIEVESALGKGTTFHVFLPVVEAGAPTSVAQSADTRPTCSGRILVVDDVELIREFTEAFLRSAGYATRVAKDAEQALKLLEEEQFDLLFTDNKMPGISGHELIERVVIRWPRIKCILATGYLEEKVQQQLSRQPNVRTLLKPYHVTEAIKLVGDLLVS
jgi:PAS domain S-box-containing protein